MSIVRRVYHVPTTLFDWDCCYSCMPTMTVLPPLPSLPPMPTLSSSCCGCSDPFFDDFQRMVARKNQMWMDRPCLDFCSLPPPPPLKLTIKGPGPAKYRLSIDCSGYDPKSIKTEIKDGKLNVSGSEKSDTNSKEFAKSYSLPLDAETEKMTTSMTPGSQLVVEMPLKSGSGSSKTLAINEAGSPFPQIVENEKGQKVVSFRLNLPKNIDPANINVKCRERELVVKAEEKIEKDNGRSSTSYYQRTTLPENTDLSGIKCVYDNDHLAITAPVSSDFLDGKNVPVEYKK